MLRRFHLDRKVDISGVSGISPCVAEGVLFSDGQCCLHWNTEHPSVAIYQSISDLILIHSHGDCTKVIFDDPPESDKKSS